MMTVCLQAQCFSTSYSDTGLFGVQAVASYFDIGKVCILFLLPELLVVDSVFLICSQYRPVSK